jgi:hypothetical protein
MSIKMGALPVTKMGAFDTNLSGLGPSRLSAIRPPAAQSQSDDGFHCRLALRQTARCIAKLGAGADEFDAGADFPRRLASAPVRIVMLQAGGRAQRACDRSQMREAIIVGAPGRPPSDFIFHNLHYPTYGCRRKVRMSGYGKVELSAFLLDGFRMGGVVGLGQDERSRSSAS